VHTVDLSSNKLMLAVSSLLGFIFLSLSRLDVAILHHLKWFGGLLIIFSVLMVFLVQANKLFVHIDKAGVSYGLGFTVKYIHQETIQSIQKSTGLFGGVLHVKTQDGKVHHFYAWQMSDADFSKAERLLSL